MNEGSERYTALLTHAVEVAAAADRYANAKRALVGDAKRELQLAATWHLRRASVPASVDNLTFAHGSNEHALGGLDICPIALLGLKAAGAVAYQWLVEAAMLHPAGSYIDHARIALQLPERRAYCVELGAYHRFQHKLEVYHRAVTDWQASPSANDPAARWRRRAVTAKQRYLMNVVGECLSAAEAGAQPPVAANRGTAHDWLHDAGGHPMFWHRPSPPSALR